MGKEGVVFMVLLQSLTPVGRGDGDGDSHGLRRRRGVIYGKFLQDSFLVSEFCMSKLLVDYTVR